MRMTVADWIADTGLTGREIARRLMISPAAVSNWKRRNRLPSPCYRAIQKMSEEAGAPFPHHLFEQREVLE